MNKLRGWLLRLRGLFLRTRREEDLAAELQSHVQLAAEENIRSGMTPDEARRQALLKLGSVEATKEACREQLSIPLLETLWRHVRFGARQLRKNPGFTIMAVLTLGLGIGATTAIFSVVYATLFEALPYPKPEQLVMVWTQISQVRNSTSGGDYLEWKRRSTSFQYLEAWTGGTFNVGTLERPEQVPAALMTPGFFRMTGTPMWMGRDFLPEEGEPGKDKVVIMTHKAWRQFFGADQSILGKPIRMNEDMYTVIGVTAPGMRDRQASQFMLPLAFKPEMKGHADHSLRVMGRLKEGVSVRQANAELQVIGRQLASEFPQTNAKSGVSVEPLKNNFIPPSTIRNLWLLLGAVSFLLLIGCVNIANLLLARGTVRQREVAIRAALGATRGQIFGQFLTENVMLALLGGALGIYLTHLIVGGILSILPYQMLPSEANIRLSVPVLVFTIVASVFAGLLSGSAPAWRASRCDLTEVLNQGGRSGLASGGRGLRRALVVTEFALAVTLLAGGSLALRSFWKLTQLDLGLQPDHVLTFNLAVPRSRLRDSDRLPAYYRQLLERIQSVPGVRAASLSSSIPVRTGMAARAFRMAGSAPAESGAQQTTGFQTVTPGYFETLGIRMVAGRRFTEQDLADSPLVAMVNETFARRYLAAGNPIGQHVIVNEPLPTTPPPGPQVDREIVGIFHNTRGGDGLRGDDVPVMYVPFWQSVRAGLIVAVRTSGEPEKMTRNLAAGINAVDPDVALVAVKTMNQVLDETLSLDRFGTVLYGSFALAALLLATIGIYGVMAFGVAQRTHEFGIRTALGASAGEILAMVLREGIILALAGLLFGLAGAYVMGRALESSLYHVNALDFGALGGAAVLLVGAALLASFLPARRASRVAPMIALRCE